MRFKAARLLLHVISVICDILLIRFPPIPTTGAIIVHKGKILVIRVAKSKYTLPGGILRSHETLEDCLKREVLEETGLHVQSLTYFGQYPCKVQYPTINFTYIVRIKGGTLRKSSEGTPVWVNIEEVNNKFVYLDNNYTLIDYLSKFPYRDS